MASSGVTSMWAAGLGAGIMLVLDPWQGRERRVLVRDKTVPARHASRKAIRATSRHLTHRTAGVIATARARMRPDTADDDRIVARVAAAIGHVVSHPGAITVSAWNGHIALKGPVPADEMDA